MKIEWAHHSHLLTKDRADRVVADAKNFGTNITPYLPVVRVDELEKWIKNQMEEPLDLSSWEVQAKLSAYRLILDKLASLKEQP